MTDVDPASSHAPDSSGASAVATAPRRSRIAPFAAAGVAFILALFVWMLATSDSGEKKQVASPLLSKVAPPVTGTGFRGDAFNLDAEKGNWVIINFFSTTCVPCKIEHPELVKLSERHQAAGDLSMVSITFEDKAANVKSFFEKNGGTWPVLLNDTGPIAISYGVTAVPESYLISPSGLVARKIVGGITADGIDTLIQRLGG